MRRQLLAVGILVFAVAGFAVLKATRPEPPPVEVRERVWRVAAEQVQPGEARPTLTLYGRIEAPDQLRAAAPTAGRVLKVAVRDGEQVAAGALLAQMDPRDLAPRVDQARAEVEREHIRHRHDLQAIEQERQLLALVEARVARFDALRARGFSAETAYDQTREERARARLALTQREQAVREHPARLAQLQARLVEAERDAARGELRAPFAARVGRVEVAAGDQLQPGQTLLTLYPASALYLRARVPAVHAEELRAALDAGEHLVAQAEFGAARFGARLERMAGEADARGVDMLLRVDDGSSVPVGAFVNAVLERPRLSGVLSLPPTALHGGRHIFQIEDGRLRQRAVVRLGERREGDNVRQLLRVPDFDPALPVMTTHLPNALDGMAVERVDVVRAPAAAAR